MPLAQSSELPPPKRDQRVDAARGGEDAARLDHFGIRIRREVVERKAAMPASQRVARQLGRVAVDGGRGRKPAACG